MESAFHFQSDIADNRNMRHRRMGMTLFELFVALFVLVVIASIMLPPVTRGRGAGRRTQCRNNLKQIALALRNYESDYQALPPAYTIDQNGRRLHSWRTLILPYLDQKELYAVIDLSKPWDDPANATACKMTVPAFLCPSATLQASQTTYLAITGPTSCFPSSGSRPLSEIRDGLEKTLMVIDVPGDKAIHWMAPQDLDESSLLEFRPEMKLSHAGGVQAAFADGHTEFVSLNLPVAELRSMISIAGSD